MIHPKTVKSIKIVAAIIVIVCSVRLFPINIDERTDDILAVIQAFALILVVYYTCYQKRLKRKLQNSNSQDFV